VKDNGEVSPKGTAMKSHRRDSGTPAMMQIIMPTVMTAPIQPLIGIFSMRGPQCGSM
jgi:hypothetical protein